MNIPFLSLHDVTALHGAEINEAVTRVVNNGWYLQGKENEQFEKHYSEFIGCKHTIGCANGLDALTLTLRCFIELGVMHQGDEVIVPAYTYTATASVTQHIGCKLVMVDSQKNSVEMDYGKLSEAITEHTKVIVPVDIAGIVADYDRVFEIVEEKRHLFCPGNHDLRGMANRHLERVWMYRQPEERLSRDWDLGRNFAVRMGDIALIGLDTAEDKQDTNPLFAGLYNSQEYRKAQTEWLKHALKQKDIASAPHIVAFCHIPLFDDDPTHNPGDVAPADKDPAYTKDFALWQRTCANMWTPLLQKAGCRVIITAHMHKYRFDAPTGSRKWAQIVGGGPKINSKNGFPTVIEGFTEGKELVIRIHNVSQETVVAEHRFNAK